MFKLEDMLCNEISGGDYQLTVDLEVPSNNVGLGIGQFFNGYLAQTSTTNNEIIRTFISYTNRFLYLPGVHITNIDLQPI